LVVAEAMPVGSKVATARAAAKKRTALLRCAWSRRLRRKDDP
jgi:hypothetical protein